MSQFHRWAIVGATSLLILSGCGQDDRSAIKQTVRSYMTAIADGNGKAACKKLTGEAARGLASSTADLVPELNVASCEEAISALAGSVGGDEARALRDVEVKDVTINGDSARARATGATRDAELRKVDGHWYISGGLTP